MTTDTDDIAMAFSGTKASTGLQQGIVSEREEEVQLDNSESCTGQVQYNHTSDFTRIMSAASAAKVGASFTHQPTQTSTHAGKQGSV